MTASEETSEQSAPEYNADADSYGSWLAAIAEIGRRVKAGEEPIPTTGYFGKRDA